MTAQQGLLFSLLGIVFAFFLWGKVRYDIVAFGALVVAFLAGVVPAKLVFSGFGHPAVVIIALVLILSRGLTRSGAIEKLARYLVKPRRSLAAHVGVMGGIAAVLSSFMNNVAALALLMPVDLQAARQAKRSPGLSLMPLSFASILGGMITLIGTPPNVVIATFRESALGEPYGMFDFFPVGGTVALAGILFVVLIGHRLIPAERGRHDQPEELKNIQQFLSEASVQPGSPLIGKALKELDSLAEEHDLQIIGVVRQGRVLPGLARDEVIREKDTLALEGSPDAMDPFLGAAGLKFSGSEKYEGLASGSVSLTEAVVPEGARIAGRSAMDIRLLYRQGVTLLGLSRKGRRINSRVRKTVVRAGDLLLLLGPEDKMAQAIEWLGCLPLAERGLELTQRRKAWLAIALFAAAIVVASAGWLYLPMALAFAVVAYVALSIVPVSQVYESVEWPVLVLVGSMIPIGGALESTGGTALITNTLMHLTQGLPAMAVLVLLMVVTMTLSDVLNNVTTAIIAAPIAIQVAQRLQSNPDAFLMAVAVASSCAFLTPIGHKNNTIILGPGGYSFGDFWRLGLPLEVLVIVVSVPVIALVWPL